MGAATRLVRILEDGRNDVAGLLRAIDRTTKVVFACTPNNPSGAPLAAEEIRALAAGVPDDVLLVVDEAYFEFDAAEGGTGALDELARRRGPWLSTRTLSKAYAIAGMRVGYGLAGTQAVADGLLRVKLNFNLSRVAVGAAQAALADEPYSQECIAKLIAERRRLAAGIEGLGFATLPSRANFVSFDYRANAVPVMAAMAAEGVFVREWRDPGFETFIRITVGLPEENDRALRTLASAGVGQGLRRARVRDGGRLVSVVGDMPDFSSASAVAGSSAKRNSERSLRSIMPCRTIASKLITSFQ